MSSMEEQLHPLAVTHLLQHTLRSLCNGDNSQWVYAVFWRILPRNYPPPKWDLPGSIYDRSRGNRRNWILVWEDGFCNFAASCGERRSVVGESGGGATSAPSCGGEDCEIQSSRGLQPELFFKMSHEIYNYGEGLIGKVASDHGHKWVYKEPQDQEVNFLPAWHSPADSHPRTWEAQFQAGIKTIALIAVREGVVQLGSVSKVLEDLSYVVLLRKKFSYLESIPGVLLPHPSSSAFPFKVEGCNHPMQQPMDGWALHGPPQPPPPSPMADVHNHFPQPVRITPSMSSLEALLSKLPSVGPAAPSGSSPAGGYYVDMPMLFSPQKSVDEGSGIEKMAAAAKDEMEADGYREHERGLELGSENGNRDLQQVPFYVNVNQQSEGC